MKNLKYILLIALIYASVTNLSAQLYEEGFENTGTTCGTTAFLMGCFPDWINTHGSAGLKVSSIANSSFEGNRHARMYVRRRSNCVEPDRGEGIALNYDFKAGICYKISYAIKGEAMDTKWILTNGLTMDGDNVIGCNGNDVVPDIPLGSSIISGTDFQLNSDDWLHMEEISFTPSADFSQLWFRASNVTASNNQLKEVFLDDVQILDCCGDPIKPCEITTDLTACPANDDFGFIALECDGIFDWQFPAGSTATSLTGGGQSLVVNASPGTYSVTMTDATGCIRDFSFVVTEDCCDDINICPPPTGLDCIIDKGNVIGLTWNPVLEAQSYSINITPNDPSCGCLGIAGAPFSIPVNEPPFLFNYGFSFNCYSWNVVTICKEGVQSEPSDKICVDKFGCKISSGGGSR